MKFWLRKVRELAEDRGFLICQNVKIAHIKVADTAGTNAHITYGEGLVR